MDENNPDRFGFRAASFGISGDPNQVRTASLADRRVGSWGRCFGQTELGGIHYLEQEMSGTPACAQNDRDPLPHLGHHRAEETNKTFQQESFYEIALWYQGHQVKDACCGDMRASSESPANGPHLPFFSGLPALTAAESKLFRSGLKIARR